MNDPQKPHGEYARDQQAPGAKTYADTVAERERRRGRAGRGRADVEKRWQDTGSYRAAALYALAVIGVAAIVCAIFFVVDRENIVLASLVPGVLFLGGIGALANAYRTYRRGGTWPMWQGAAWFLFALMLVTLSFPALAA